MKAKRFKHRAALLSTAAQQLALNGHELGQGCDSVARIAAATSAALCVTSSVVCSNTARNS